MKASNVNVYLSCLASTCMTIGLCVAGGASLRGQESTAPPTTPSKVADTSGEALSRKEEAAPHPHEIEPTAQLVSRIEKSIVTIRTLDRNGGELGMGTGFVIDQEGLIATNFHVISEGRPIQIELGPKKPLKVLAVEASSRQDDIAILRVDPGTHTLTPLPLADGPTISQGTNVLAIGNPLGLRHSVVQGVVSAVREIENRQMIQLAIPIEPGNSGGPLIDVYGTVHGIINMKSAVAKNIGFAIPIQTLRNHWQVPNPISMDRWVRMSGVDPKRWTTVFGGEWRERSGIVHVQGSGKSFGERLLCLREQDVPRPNFELAVEVKLMDERGAAGLVFFSDGRERNYGFYPSNGKMRLSCFQGPNVMTWEVLEEVATPHYHPDEWNELKVAVSGDRIQGYVNGQLVVDMRHSALRSGKVGLASYRGTEAEFRRFRLAENLDDEGLDKALTTWVDRLADGSSNVQEIAPEELELFKKQANPLSQALNHEAEQLQRRASQLRMLADDLRFLPILDRLTQLLDEEDIDDLLVGSLLIAALDHPDLDIPYYVDRFDQIAEEIRQSLPEGTDDHDKLQALNRYLFEENGFHGGIDEYYHQANNHLDRVLDDREGMPITLCVLYMELGRRLGLSIEGVGLPGHFVVRFLPKDGEKQLIDVFEKGKPLSDTDVAMIVMMHSQRLTAEEDLEAQSTRQILSRMLHNLLGSAQRAQDIDGMRRYADGLVSLEPDATDFRWLRALMRYETQRYHLALEDLDWLIARSTEENELLRVMELRREIEKLHIDSR